MLEPGRGQQAGIRLAHPLQDTAALSAVDKFI